MLRGNQIVVNVAMHQFPFSKNGLGEKSWVVEHHLYIHWMTQAILATFSALAMYFEQSMRRYRSLNALERDPLKIANAGE